MKLFFATNSETLKTENKHLLTVSINSALKNTNFEVFLIYDGDKKELNLPKNVTVIEHRHRCYESFSNSKNEINLMVTSSAFLRTEIPYLIKKLGFDDKFCLYSDYDVIFENKNFDDLNSLTPKYFAASTEFGKNDWSYYNSGFMVMNIDNLFKDDMKVLNYISENFESMDAYDQTMYNILYSGKINKLEIEYNWKPYWGINHNAKVIHFHGIKPTTVQKTPPQNLKEYYINNKLSYDYYNNLFETHKKI